jgi:anti-sigma regulatory factor (Ser/Thr protein kinase)
MNGDEVRLSLPARPEFVSVARLTLSALAGRLGFGVDGAEDIKLAVAEAMTLLLRPKAGGDSVSLLAAWTDEHLDIDLERRVDDGGLAEDDEEAAIAQLVMAEFMDEAAVSGAPPALTVRLRKQRDSAGAAGAHV